jgi:hypothetical protein
VRLGEAKAEPRGVRPAPVWIFMSPGVGHCPLRGGIVVARLAGDAVRLKGRLGDWGARRSRPIGTRRLSAPGALQALAPGKLNAEGDLARGWRTLPFPARRAGRHWHCRHSAAARGGGGSLVRDGGVGELVHATRRFRWSTAWLVPVADKKGQRRRRGRANTTRRRCGAPATIEMS